MSIKVRYFASLKESVGRSEDNLAITGSLTVNEVWNRLNSGKSLPGNILAAVNMEYVELDSLVKELNLINLNKGDI